MEMFQFHERKTKQKRIKGIHQRMENHSFIKLLFFWQIYKGHRSSHKRYYFLLYFLFAGDLGFTRFLYPSMFLPQLKFLTSYGTFFSSHWFALTYLYIVNSMLAYFRKCFVICYCRNLKCSVPLNSL